MKKVKFLHCADLHLDAPFTTLGSDSAKASVRRMDLKDAFDRIINTAMVEKVDIMLICGDLYEHDYVRKSMIAHVNDRFSEIPDVHVFMIPGNHDPYVSSSFYRNYPWSKNVHILCGDNPAFVLHELNTCVHGIGFKDFRREASQLNDIKPMDRDYINILLLHGTVDMDFRKDNNLYNPVSSDELSRMGMDYIALGHFHGRSDDIGGHGLIYNPGSPEPLGFDESGEHGIYIGCIKKEDGGYRDLEIRFSPTAKKYYVNIDVNISGCTTEAQVAGKVWKAIEESRPGHDALNGLFYVTLKGYIAPELRIDFQQLLSYFNGRVFFIKMKNGAAPDLNFDEIKREPGLRGLYARKIFELMEKASDEHEKELLMRSLYYGIEALDNGKVDIG